MQGDKRLSNPNAQFMHTTEPAGLQSNLEANDLAELMDLVRPSTYAQHTTHVQPKSASIANRVLESLLSLAG